MSHITSVSPPVPTNPPLGITWVSDDVGEPGGPLAVDLGRLADGLVRVQKTCRQCTTEFDGWMFAATYEKRRRKWEAKVATAIENGDDPGPDIPEFHVGLHRFCPSCQSADEKRGEVARLGTIIEHTRKRWESARHLKDKMPAGRELAKHLERMMELLRFGSDRFAAASDQYDAVNGWLLSNQPEI